MPTCCVSMSTVDTLRTRMDEYEEELNGLKEQMGTKGAGNYIFI